MRLGVRMRSHKPEVESGGKQQETRKTVEPGRRPEIKSPGLCPRGPSDRDIDRNACELRPVGTFRNFYTNRSILPLRKIVFIQSSSEFMRLNTHNGVLRARMVCSAVEHLQGKLVFIQLLGAARNPLLAEII